MTPIPTLCSWALSHDESLSSGFGFERLGPPPHRAGTRPVTDYGQERCETSNRQCECQTSEGMDRSFDYVRYRRVRPS